VKTESGINRIYSGRRIRNKQNPFRKTESGINRIHSGKRIRNKQNPFRKTESGINRIHSGKRIRNQHNSIKNNRNDRKTRIYLFSILKLQIHITWDIKVDG
jgi:hypothetical protein